jgi:hypothetical protein
MNGKYSIGNRPHFLIKKFPHFHEIQQADARFGRSRAQLFFCPTAEPTRFADDQPRNHADGASPVFRISEMIVKWIDDSRRRWLPKKLILLRNLVK